MLYLPQHTIGTTGHDQQGSTSEKTHRLFMLLNATESCRVLEHSQQEGQKNTSFFPRHEQSIFFSVISNSPTGFAVTHTLSFNTTTRQITCDHATRNESHCYSFTFWVQPLSQRGCHKLYRFWLFHEINSPVFSTSEKCACYTHTKFISVISKCLKQATLQ